MGGDDGVPWLRLRAHVCAQHLSSGPEGAAAIGGGAALIPSVVKVAAAGAPIAGFGTVEVTTVAARNPDVVLTLPSGAGGLAAQVVASPAWAGSKAVKKHRVFELDSNTFLRAPGPGVVKARQLLADLLYPR